MIDPHDRLADEVQAVPKEQVVGLVDAARLRIVERHEPRGDARERALLRIRTRLALVRDDVHRGSLRRARLANRQRPWRATCTRASQRLKVSTSTLPPTRWRRGTNASNLSSKRC